MLQIANNAKRYWIDFIHLLIPLKCVICKNELTPTENILCSCCWCEMPLTEFENATEPTHLDRLFWGRVKLYSTYSLIYYKKNNFYKNLLHDLKYNYRPDIGEKMGEALGEKLRKLHNFSTVDAILPVPIHPKKKKMRGYNQAHEIAKGITKTLQIPINENLIKRVQHNESQTKMSRFNRWDNIKESFTATDLLEKYNHILLVDDVITTGATLESIILQIQIKSPQIRISVASLAVAKK